MILSRSELDTQDLARFRTVTSFLEDRLAEPEIVDWALRLRPDRQIERAAIFELLVGPGSPRLPEPYATAWPLILESWSYRATGDSPASALRQIRRRLRGGDRSGNLVDAIANFAAPRLEVKPLQARPWSPSLKSRGPKKLSDLLSAGLTSASLVFDFRKHCVDIGLDERADTAFLYAVASALMSAVDRGLYIARRIYGGNEHDWPSMASPLRVYFVPPKIGVNDWDGPGGRVFEPDAPIRGVGPAVKMLHAVLQRITELDAGTASSVFGGWRQSDMAVYRRLWAAVARNADAVSAAEVGEFLIALDDSDFWNFPSFPEFAELRAVRFGDFEPQTQALIVKRLRKGLPRKFFPRKMEAEEIRSTRRGFAAMELRRIEIGGGTLPVQDQKWLRRVTEEFPGLKKMAIDGGFRDPWVRPCIPPSIAPRSRFDDLEGESRLQALEDALSSETFHYQATDWLRQSDHVIHILHDLEGAASLLNRFPRVWDSFGHIHTQPESETRDAESESARVLALLDRISDETIEVAINGICHWLYMWSEHVIRSEVGRQVWLRIWPCAVKLTNAIETGEAAEPEQVDPFHLPVGKLLRVFLALFQFKNELRDPFGDGSLLARMRDCSVAAPGRSGLIAHCQFTQKLPEFLQIAPAWARQRLIDPLLMDNEKSVLLWRAVASTWIDSDILETIGAEASKRVLDDRLGKDTRKDLVSCLVHEGLTAFRDRRDPSVSLALISQTLRNANDEIREEAAYEIRQFQDDAYKSGQGPQALGISFRSIIKPFLERVWPQERLLATAGVSHHLSCLPAVSGEAFPEAVHEVERFLVPFDPWSMLSYGFHEGDMAEQMRMPQLADLIDDAKKAQALLRLLDLTIGDSENSAIPTDLSGALDRIASKAATLTSCPAFRRLAAAARR